MDKFKIKCHAYEMLHAGIKRNEVIMDCVSNFRGASLDEITQLVDEVIAERSAQKGYFDPKSSTNKPQAWSAPSCSVRVYNIPKGRR